MKKLFSFFMSAVMLFSFSITTNLVGVFAEDTDFYVGYSDKTGANSFSTIRSALEEASVTGNKTIHIAPGVYSEGILTVMGDNITIVNDTKNPDDVLITNSPTSDTKYDYYGNKIFHSGTFILRGNYLTINDISVQNTVTGTNSCALENYGRANVLNNVKILARCDTLYTGDKNTKQSMRLNNCYITGFQDVVCGGGTNYFNNCTIYVNQKSDARLFAPTGNLYYNGEGSDPEYQTRFYIKNLSVDGEDVGSKIRRIFFGRPWTATTSWNDLGYISCKETLLTIDGYNLTPAAANRMDRTSFYGFDDECVGKTGTGESVSTTKFCVREKETDDYFTTLTGGVGNDLALTEADVLGDYDGFIPEETTQITTNSDRPTQTTTAIVPTKPADTYIFNANDLTGTVSSSDTVGNGFFKLTSSLSVKSTPASYGGIDFKQAGKFGSSNKGFEFKTEYKSKVKVYFSSGKVKVCEATLEKPEAIREFSVTVQPGTYTITPSGNSNALFYYIEVAQQDNSSQSTTKATTETTTQAITELTTQATTEVTTQATTEVTTQVTTETTTQATTEVTTTTDVSLGDINGDKELTASDAANVLSYVLNSDEMAFDENKKIIADVNKDKTITAVDAANILSKVLNNDFVF